MLKIKRDDEVIVIAGKDKGRRGKVRKLVGDDRVVVAGVNMIKKHTKPNPQAGSRAVSSSARRQCRCPTSRSSTPRPARQTV
jgi:ribosomal protein L24